MDTKVLFVGNYKGGVGKTTSVLNFAKYFTIEGKRILVLDLDPQSSLSEILISNNHDYNGQLSDLDETKTLNYVFDLHISRIKRCNSLNLHVGEDIVQTYRKGKFDFIASSLFYKNGMGLDELAVRMEDNVEYLSILKQFLEAILKVETYDYVLIDCPPSNNLITRSAFLASDFYIIPTILDSISTNGVAHYIQTVQKTYKRYCVESEDCTLMKHYFGAPPRLVGIFCTFMRGQVDYRQSLRRLKDNVCHRCKCEEDEIFIFEEEINNYIDIARSTEIGDVSKARKDYEALSKRVLDRIMAMDCG